MRSLSTGFMLPNPGTHPPPPPPSPKLSLTPPPPSLSSPPHRSPTRSRRTPIFPDESPLLSSAPAKEEPVSSILLPVLFNFSHLRMFMFRMWNRTIEKAAKKAARLVTEMKEDEGFESLEIEECGSLDEAVRVGDIVSCATNSEVGLVKGVVLKEGAHLDLVGSFKETMRECDEEAVRRGRVFVDNVVVLDEAGELIGAVVRAVVGRESVGTLVELIEGEKKGR
ncbi:hypothetical protein Droror1_Dr00027519, partial [Drosera rotundifolia]